MKSLGKRAIERTSSGAAKGKSSVNKEIQSVLKSGAKPQYLVFQYNPDIDNYLPHSHGDRERVRRALDDSWNEGFEKRRKNAFLIAEVIAHFFKKLFGYGGQA